MELSFKYIIILDVSLISGVLGIFLELEECTSLLPAVLDPVETPKFSYCDDRSDCSFGPALSSSTFWKISRVSSLDTLSLTNVNKRVRIAATNFRS